MFSISLVTIKGSIFGGPSATVIGYAGPDSDKSSAGEPSDLHIPFQDLSNNPDIFSLLSWHCEVSQFVGREEELEELERWAFENRNISIKFITGEGGAGKSRLAAEFAKTLKESGWNAGFVDLRKPQSFKIDKEGALLIVDYPEENLDETIELFRDLSGTTTSERLRILFITRQSIDDWEGIIHDGKAMPIVDQVPVIVKRLDSTKKAHQIFYSTQKYAANVFNSTPLGIPEDIFEAWLNLAPENKLGLFIVALGVHSALYPEEKSIRYNGHELVEALVKREKYRIRSIAKTRGLKKDTFLLLLAIAIIADRIPISRIREITQSNDFQKIFPDGNKIVSNLEASGILNNKCILALKPDIVAASFLITVLSEEPDFAPELIWNGLVGDPQGGVSRLARLIYDAEIVMGIHQQGKLSNWFAKALDNNLDRCKKISNFLTETLSSYGLIEANITASKTLIHGETDDIEIARLSNNMSIYLSNFGRREEALEAAKRAVEIYERLAASNPDAFEPDLAMSLNNMGTMYSDLGRREEALEAAKRAVEIRERLAASNPDAFEPDLAMSFGAMGSICREFSKNVEAQKSFEKGVAVLKRAFMNNPGAFSSLMNNLCSDYTRMSERICKSPDKSLLDPILYQLKNKQ